MSRKKNEKPVEENEESPTPKPPWAVEVEFLTKPSFMCSVTEFRVDGDRVVVVKEDGTIHTFPYSNVSKILVMNTTKKKYPD